MRLAENDDMVQTLTADRTKQLLGVTILPGGARRDCYDRGCPWHEGAGCTQARTLCRGQVDAT